MTAQTPDIILYEGTRYRLHSTPLDQYEEQHPFPYLGREVMTSCLRGYVAHWAVRGDFLYLDKVDLHLALEEVWIESGVEIGLPLLVPGVSTPWLADWYSGELRLQRGRLVYWVHAGFESRFEEEIVLTVTSGRIVRIPVEDNRHWAPSDCRRGALRWGRAFPRGELGEEGTNGSRPTDGFEPHS